MYELIKDNIKYFDKDEYIEKYGNNDWFENGMYEDKYSNILPFNWETYLDRYEDVKRVYGNNKNAAEKHWKEYGFNEGRIGSKYRAKIELYDDT